MLVAFMFAAALDTAAAAQPTTPTTPADAREKAKTEMVCRTEAVTGSHLTKKICMSREDWEAISERDSRALARIQSQHLTPTGGFSP